MDRCAGKTGLASLMVLHRGELDKSAHEATQMTTAQPGGAIPREAAAFRGSLEFARRKHLEHMAAHFRPRPSDLSVLQSSAAPRQQSNRSLDECLGSFGAVGEKLSFRME